MPRVCTVCAHPSREAIDRELVAGVASFRNISERFGTSATALHRHKKEHLPETILQAHAAREQEAAIDVMGELERCFGRVNLLFDACDRWLRDPEDPSRYDVGARAEEIAVIYTETEQSIEGLPVNRRRKDSLAELLERVERAGEEQSRAVRMVETKHADPRELVLKTAARLRPQIELMARLIGELDDSLTVNIAISPQVQTVILEALTPHPAARQAVADALAELEAA